MATLTLPTRQQLVEQSNPELVETYSTPHGMTPPSHWLEPDPTFTLKDSTRISEAGRFTAWSHDWATPHIGTTAAGEEHHWYAEPSKVGNAYFNRKDVVTADGATLKVGAIPLYGGHADKYASVEEAQQHYDNPEHVRVYARANDTADGCQINGFIAPGTTKYEVAMMRLLGLSGDWRWMPALASLDYVGPCFVVREGIPEGVTASAHIDADIPSLFRDRRSFTLNVDNGRIVSVTASTVITERVYTDRINKMEQIAVTASQDIEQPTVQAMEEGADANLVAEIAQRVGALEDAVTSLQEAVAALEASSEDVAEIDAETPDTE
jgi:hypothetical protein